MFKKLKSLFIEDDGEGSEKEAAAAKEEQKKEQVEATASPSQQSTTASTSGTPEIGEGKVTNKFVEILFGAVEKNNLDGYDYLEYKQSLKALSKMPMDEEMRYQSAFAAAKPLGATPQKLVESAGHYLNVLKQEESKFSQALVQQKSKQIGDRETRLKQLDSIIVQKQKQIEQLNKEIEEHQQHKEKMKNEISSSSIKVETTKNNFIASYNKIVGQIQSDINNMKKYLK